MENGKFTLSATAVLISDFNYMVIVAKRRKKEKCYQSSFIYFVFALFFGEIIIINNYIIKYKEVERVLLCGGWQPVLRFIVTTYYDKRTPERNVYY